MTMDQAVQLASTPEILIHTSGPDVVVIMNTIANASLSPSQKSAISKAMQTAPRTVRDVFEEKQNLFANGFDEYIPIDSRVPIGDRRMLIVIAIVVIFLNGAYSKSNRASGREDN